MLETGILEYELLQAINDFIRHNNVSLRFLFFFDALFLLFVCGFKIAICFEIPVWMENTIQNAVNK